MSRFKDLRRIEAALSTRDLTELRWAIAYCETRLRYARLESHAKHWRGLIKKIRAKLPAAGPTGAA